MKTQVAVLDRAVAKSGYVAGDELTFADMNLWPILWYVRRYPEGESAVAAASNLARYYERQAQRPSFRNTVPPPPPEAPKTAA